MDCTKWPAKWQRGLLDFLILAVISAEGGPTYGYRIVQDLEERGFGRTISAELRPNRPLAVAVDVDAGVCAIVIFRIHAHPETYLPDMHLACRGPGFLPSLRENGEKYGCQDSNDGYHNEELDKSEPVAFRSF